MTDLISDDGLDFYSSYDEIFDSFDSMDLKQNLIKGIYEYGFKNPSQVQKRCIVPFTKGLDVVQQAEIGTGKTTVFCIGILQQLDYGLNEIQALVLVPTPELAKQVENVIKGLGAYLGVKVHACVGWISLAETREIVSSGVHVVVGTPTCVFDFMGRKFITDSDYVKMIVLDDADELLRGDCFRDQVHHIFGLLPSKFQVGLFSATMSPEVLEITRKFMDNPVMILVKQGQLTLDGIKHFYMDVDREEWKIWTLIDLCTGAFNITPLCMGAFNITPTVIFVNTSRKVGWLTKEMRDQLCNVITNGDLYQNTREFDWDSSGVLITHLFGVLADVQRTTTLVINFDLPPRPENYLNRVGRNGRFGSKLVVINLVTKDDKPKLSNIEMMYNVIIQEAPLVHVRVFHP